MERGRFYKLLPFIMAISVAIWINLNFLHGGFFPIAKGTIRGGIVSALGVAVILAVSFGIVLLIHYFQRKRK